MKQIKCETAASLLKRKQKSKVALTKSIWQQANKERVIDKGYWYIKVSDVLDIIAREA